MLSHTEMHTLQQILFKRFVFLEFLLVPMLVGIVFQ